MAVKRKTRTTPKRHAGKYWSKRVMETSDALDLDNGVFKLRSACAIASSLKRSAERSRRRKSTPFRSAMSMLVFYANRGGKNLSLAERRKLDAAKRELRKLYGKPSPRP
jgi:hypothetical protein